MHEPRLTWFGWPLWNICVTNDHEYVPLVVNTSRSFPHSRLITGFVTRLTRRVQLVEQELLNLPEHLSSSPVFSGVRSYSIFSFIYMFCRSLFVLLNGFLWSLCCLFFDIRILIAPLESSNSSWMYPSILFIYSPFLLYISFLCTYCCFIIVLTWKRLVRQHHFTKRRNWGL